MKTQMAALVNGRLGAGIVAAVGAAVLLLGGVALAAISYQSSQTAASTQVTYTSVDVTKPTSVAAGDLMLANIAVHGGDMAVVNLVPSGWTLIGSTTNDSSLLLLSYWKIAGGSEPSSYEWRIAGQTTGHGGITRYTGVDTSTPIDASGANTGLGLTATTSVITTTVASATIVTLLAVDEGRTNTAGSYFATPSGMTERYDVSNTPFGPSIALDDVVQATAGSVASKSSAIGGNNKPKNWASQIIALRRAVAAVAFDSATSGGLTGSGSGPYTKSFTNTNGNFVAVAYNQAKPIGDSISSMTYGGASCSQVEFISGYSGNNNDRDFSLWACPDAPTGTNNLSVSYSASAEDGGIASIVSYSGAASSQPDSHNQSYTGTGASSYSATLSSSATNDDWMISAYLWAGPANTLSAGASTTVRENGRGYFGFVDSGGSVGSASSSWTTNVTASASGDGRSQMSMMLSPQ